MAGIKAIPPRKPISLQFSLLADIFTNPFHLTPFAKNRSPCLTNKPARANMCTLRLCAKAPTVAIVNLHEWLEVSKQWGNRALPIMARYWYRCLVCLLWAQRNSFHLLSGRTMLLVLCCLLRAGMLKWWDVPVCHCMFCHRVSICSCTQTSVHCRHQSSLGAACDFSLYIFEERTPLQERMIMLLPRGKALRSIRVRIHDCSAASTGETKRPQPKEGASGCLSSPLPANDSWDLADGKCHKDGGSEERLATLHTLQFSLHINVFHCSYTWLRIQTKDAHSYIPLLEVYRR